MVGDRYYVQRGLIPRPTGVGRGSHYTEAHLTRLREVRAQQEQGVPLAAIVAGAPLQERATDLRPSSHPAPAESAPAGAPPARSAEGGAAWFRSALGPDVELHVRGRRLAPTTLEALRRVLRAHDDTQEGEPT